MNILVGEWQIRYKADPWLEKTEELSFMSFPFFNIRFVPLVCKINNSICRLALQCSKSFMLFVAGNFYLTDIYASDESRLADMPLADPLPVISLHRKEGKRPAVFLRFRY